jgi:hypothetical protein
MEFTYKEISHLFLHHTNGYCHHQRQFLNLGKIVIANPIHIDLVQHVLTMTTHIAKVATQNKV